MIRYYKTIDDKLEKLNLPTFDEFKNMSAEERYKITAKEYMIVKIGTAFLNILIQGIAIVIYYLLACIFKSFLTGDSLLSIININSEIIDKQKSLQAGTCIAFGKMMKIPMIVKMQMPNPEPQSSNASIYDKWIVEWKN